MINSSHFTYDGVFSGTYGLQIAEFGGIRAESVEENEAFSPTLATIKVPGQNRFYHGGIYYNDAPSFQMTLVSEEPITEEHKSRILSWLVGKSSFRPLSFYADSKGGFTYYVVFTSSSSINVNGVCHGFKVTGTCDSRFARGIPTKATTTSGTHTITIDNKSEIYDDYVYPTVEFVGSSISIINTTDSATRAFEFSGLGASEKLTVDCENKIITSTVGGEKLSKFTSKNWLRLRHGKNTLSVTSSGNVTITCPYYAMIGF